MWFPRVQLGFKCLPRRTILLASNLSRMPDSACPPMPHPSAHSPLVLTQVRARFVERFSMGAPVMGGEVRGPAITGEAGWEGCCCDGSVVACD